MVISRHLIDIVNLGTFLGYGLGMLIDFEKLTSLHLPGQVPSSRTSIREYVVLRLQISLKFHNFKEAKMSSADLPIKETQAESSNKTIVQGEQV